MNITNRHAAIEKWLSNCSRFQHQPVTSVSVTCLFVLHSSIVFVVYLMTLLCIQSFVSWMKKTKETKGCLFSVRVRIVIFKDLLHILTKPWWWLNCGCCTVQHRWGLKWLLCCCCCCTSCSQRRPFESKKFIVNHALLSKWNGKVSTLGMRWKTKG